MRVLLTEDVVPGTFDRVAAAFALLAQRIVDQRARGHPALDRACRAHDELLLLYIDEAGERAADASRAWLRKSLAALGADIERLK